MTITERHRSDTLRRAIATLGAMAVLLLPACVGSDDPPTCADPRAVTTVTMADFSYDPTCVEADVGAQLEIVNEGQAPHTFTVETDAETADIDVAAGERATLTVPDIATGTYRVICTYHPQMEAALQVSG